MPEIDLAVQDMLIAYRDTTPSYRSYTLPGHAQSTHTNSSGPRGCLSNQSERERLNYRGTQQRVQETNDTA